MTQTTEALTFCAATVEIGAACTNFTDISGYGAAVAVSGGDRAYATQHTYDGDVPIIKPGKRDETMLTVRFAYTEEADPAPFETLRAMHQTPCGGPICVRYWPKGSGAPATNFKYETGVTFISTFKWPEGDADSTTIVMGEFTVPCPDLTKTPV